LKHPQLTSTLLLATCSLLTIPTSALAKGSILSPAKDAKPIGIRAVVLADGEQVDCFLQSKLSAKSGKALWVVPVPRGSDEPTLFPKKLWGKHLPKLLTTHAKENYKRGLKEYRNSDHRHGDCFCSPPAKPSKVRMDEGSVAKPTGEALLADSKAAALEWIESAGYALDPADSSSLEKCYSSNQRAWIVELKLTKGVSYTPWVHLSFASKTPRVPLGLLGLQEQGMLEADLVILAPTAQHRSGWRPIQTMPLDSASLSKFRGLLRGAKAKVPAEGLVFTRIRPDPYQVRGNVEEDYALPLALLETELTFQSKPVHKGDHHQVAAATTAELAPLLLEEQTYATNRYLMRRLALIHDDDTQARFFRENCSRILRVVVKTLSAAPNKDALAGRPPFYVVYTHYMLTHVSEAPIPTFESFVPADLAAELRTLGAEYARAVKKQGGTLKIATQIANSP